VHAQPRYEVCRRFLTCLLLTNQGNTDIVFETEEERLNEFGVRLLSTERKMIALEDGGDKAVESVQVEEEVATKAKKGKKRSTAQDGNIMKRARAGG